MGPDKIPTAVDDSAEDSRSAVAVELVVDATVPHGEHEVASLEVYPEVQWQVRLVVVCVMKVRTGSMGELDGSGLRGILPW